MSSKKSSKKGGKGKKAKADPLDEIKNFAAYVRERRYQVIITVDPGLEGAIAFVTYLQYLVVDIPVTAVNKKSAYDEQRLWEYLRVFLGDDELRPRVFFAIEQAQPGGGGSFGRGKKPCPACKRKPGDTPLTAFRVAWGCAMFQLLMVAFDVRRAYLNIAAWKKHAGLIGKDKESSRLAAQRLFPGADLQFKYHHNRAEALLMSRYVEAKYGINLAGGRPPRREEEE